MGSHEYPRQRHFTLGRIDPITAIAIAEGILIERYTLTTDLARALLVSRASARGLPLNEAANWLLCTNTLP
ncbi:hypothetical protein [Kribbella swartbergensis]